MSKILINVRELQAVKNGIMRFDTETKNFEVLDENGNWVESNAGVYNIESAATVERADNVVSAGTITNAYLETLADISGITTANTVTSAGTVSSAGTVTSATYGTILNVGASDTFVVLTQSEYDALSTKNKNTFYLIEDE